jgi:hypothetical protein
MKKAISAVVLILSFFVAPIASAAPFDEAIAALKRSDFTTALKLLTPLAEQGDAVAQHNLGVMYRDGVFVPQSYTEAVKWFRLAAQQGLKEAQFNLASMYHNGQGVTQNYTEAVKWWRLAAQQGFTNAQNNLGSSYAAGFGVPQNYVKAHMWYNIAASHASGDDNKKFSDARNEVSAKMTTVQIAEAQALAAKCEAANYKNCD